MEGRKGVLARALRRFWAVAIAAGLLAGLAAWWATTNLTSAAYTGTGLYIVPTASAAQTLAGSTLPESPYEAEGLAQTYTLLLVDDAELLGALSDVTGQPVEELRDRAVSEKVPSTPAIRVSYSGDTEAEVRDYFSGLDAVVTTTGSTGLPAGNLRALAPSQVEEQAGLAPVAPVVALLTGLLVGLAGAVLLERADRRVQGPGDLRDLTAWPVFDVRDRRGDSRLETAALRLARSGHGSVAVVTPASSPGPLADAVADHLRQMPRDSFGAVAAPAWVASGQLQTDGYAEQAVLESGAALVVVSSSTRTRLVEDALRGVADTGVQDVAVLLHDPVTAATASTSAESDVEQPSTGAPGHGAHASTTADATPPHGTRSGER
ncbi:hypothetical protein [uncultured Pseudokineococcus sp.]|uniref:hypothetical protein n=1 Tax=uncultured Pseudokineococcus sp. TaxID=1642928 RepID=UPI0026150DF8|nr:hypothetical protein [uncultured Pseudokineococcus sp.]